MKKLFLLALLLPALTLAFGRSLTGRRTPAWPPCSPVRPRSVVRPNGAVHERRLGNAFMVDTGVVLGPAFGQQYSYGAASNGNGWRVMWANDNDYSVRTSGVGTDGSLLDAQGSAVGRDQHSASGLIRSIIGTGSGFVAVWPAGDSGIWGARLDSDGALVDSFLVFEDASGQSEPAVAFDGDSTCLVVWTENPFGEFSADIYAIRVTTSGHVLDSAPIQVAADTSRSEVSPTVAFGQGIYLVAWSSVDASRAARAKVRRVSADGALLDTAIFLRHNVAMRQTCPAVGFGDTCFLCAWSEGGESYPDVYAARVSVSGGIIDPSGILLCSGTTRNMYPSVGFDGTRYLVMWEEQDTTGLLEALFGRRVTVDGVPLDPGLIRPHLAGYSCEYPSVAADHANFLVACTAMDTLTHDQGVGCVRISPSGAVLDSGIFLPLGPDVQSGPSGASNGSDFLATWLESAEHGSAVSAARIGYDGTILDPVGFPVNNTPGNKSGLATGFGDSLYLVAWADHRNAHDYDIYCARVDLQGQVLDTSGIAVCNASLDQENPDISFDGQNFLVVWGDRRSGVNGDIYAARVSLAGVVLDPNGFAVAAEDTFDDMTPAACFMGTNHLVVWQGQNVGTGQMNIYGALVSPAGAIVRPRFLVDGAQGNRWRPTVARAPAMALVAWEDARIYPAGIYATRVLSDGTVLDSNGLFVDQNVWTDELPRVTSDGAGFKILWRRYDNVGDETHLVAAKVDAAGNVNQVVNWIQMPGTDSGFDAVRGSGPDLLLLFSFRTDTAMGYYYGVDRLCGNLGPMPGIEQADNRQLRKTTSGPTIIRGVLFLPSSFLSPPSYLFSLDGRRVMVLKPGANDVSRLGPGVYFIRPASGVTRDASSVTKVVVTK